MKSEKPDFLKYWRVIRYFYKAKYGLNQADLEMLLFLSSEGYFTKDRFKEFEQLIGWDVKRFDRLRQQGWICVFRKKLRQMKAMYELSYRTKRMITEIYKKLNGEELPESDSHNPMFLKKVPYNHKVYRNMITNMNATIRRQRRQSPE